MKSAIYSIGLAGSLLIGGPVSAKGPNGNPGPGNNPPAKASSFQANNAPKIFNNNIPKVLNNQPAKSPFVQGNGNGPKIDNKIPQGPKDPKVNLPQNGNKQKPIADKINPKDPKIPPIADKNKPKDPKIPPIADKNKPKDPKIPPVVDKNGPKDPKNPPNMDKYKDSKVVSGNKHLSNMMLKNPSHLAKCFPNHQVPTAFHIKTPSFCHSFCHHHGYWGWSNYCYLPRYGCSGYYCPHSTCWYYYYEPYCCYLPVTYIVEYPPVVVSVTNATTVASSPAYPSGAQALPANFDPRPANLPVE